MDIGALIASKKFAVAHPEGEGVNLERQKDIKDKMTELDDRWAGIETQNATWWDETSNNLKDKMRPEVLEQLKDLPLFNTKLPPLDTKFDPNNLDTKGIVLTNEEKDAVKDRINRFNEGVGHANKWWGEIQHDIRELKLSPQETDELKKTDAVLLFTDKLPPSRTTAKNNYNNEQETKKTQETQLRDTKSKMEFREKVQDALEPTSLPTTNPNLALAHSIPPKIDYGKLALGGTEDIKPHVLAVERPKISAEELDLALKNSVPPQLPPQPSEFDRHLMPHTAVPTKPSAFSALPTGGVDNSILVK